MSGSGSPALGPTARVANIEVLSGAYTWNEDIAGAELVAGKVKATPMPAAVEERMIRLWANPQGAWKAAMVGTQDTSTPQCSETPGARRRDDGRQNVGHVVGQQTGGDVPDPGRPDATATATLDAKFMAESVVVKNGADTYEFTYGNYKDWNNPLHPAEAFFTGKITEKKNGTVVRDITTTVTETGQMYVVMPVPASVKAAIRPTHQPPNWVTAFDARRTAGAASGHRTPRLANGKPDLTGNWNARQSGPPRFRARAAVVPRSRPRATRDTTSGSNTRGFRRRGSAPVARTTSPSSGTRSKSSTCGRTSTIPS